MSVDPDDYDEIAKRFDKLTPEERDEVLVRLRRRSAPEKDNHVPGVVSLYDALNRTGMAGSIKDGPADLSSNPAHMEGFGEDA